MHLTSTSGEDSKSVLPYAVPVRYQQAFRIGTYILAASVVVQFLLAGLGILDTAAFFWWHANVNAAVIFFLPLILVLIGWLGKLPRRRLWLCAGVAGLVIVQSLLLTPYHLNVQGPLRAIAGLHAVNALAIFWVSVRLVEDSRSAVA